MEELAARVSQLAEENASLRLLERTLQTNSAAFEALLANCSEGIILTGPDRRIVRVVRGITGFHPNELSGVLIESLAIAEDRKTIVNAYRQLLRRETAQIRRDICFQCADGAIRRFTATLTDMLDDRNVQGIVWNLLGDHGIPAQGPARPPEA